jgi:hypothetical protein
MRKTLIEALLACALGAALGLLSDGARAANVEAESKYDSAYVVCVRAGGDARVCLMMHGPELAALKTANESLDFCPQFKAVNPEAYGRSSCPAELAYIKQRWGY